MFNRWALIYLYWFIPILWRKCDDIHFGKTPGRNVINLSVWFWHIHLTIVETSIYIHYLILFLDIYIRHEAYLILQIEIFSALWDFLLLTTSSGNIQGYLHMAYHKKLKTPDKLHSKQYRCQNDTPLRKQTLLAQLHQPNVSRTRRRESKRTSNSYVYPTPIMVQLSSLYWSRKTFDLIS